MSVLATRIATKYPVQAEMASVKLLPLLDRLAGEPDELLRRSLLTAILVMAQPGSSGDAMPTAVREGWAEKVYPPLPRHFFLSPCNDPLFFLHPVLSCGRPQPYELL